MSNHHTTQSPSTRPTRSVAEASIFEPDLLLAAALDAIEGLMLGGHTHRRGRGIRCTAACQAARRVLALAGRLPYCELTSSEQSAVLGDELGALRRVTREVLATMPGT